MVFRILLQILKPTAEAQEGETNMFLNWTIQKTGSKASHASNHRLTFLKPIKRSCVEQSVGKVILGQDGSQQLISRQEYNCPGLGTQMYERSNSVVQKDTRRQPQNTNSQADETQNIASSHC